MEVPSTSKQHPFSINNNNKSPPPPLFSANIAGATTGGGGFFSSSNHDVFVGSPKYATFARVPSPEDYFEIFTAFRSSIPVLHLPPSSALDSSFFDYSDVFAALDAADFALPYDQLFPPLHFSDDDDDEAWTPFGIGSLSDDSENTFALSEKSQCSWNQNSHQPLDSKQFNVSYHKVNLGTSRSVPNMSHVTQLNAVPGYSSVVDQTASLREMGTEGYCSAAADDIVFSLGSSSVMTHKHKRKSLCETSLDDARFKSFDGHSTCRMEPSHLPPLSKLPPEAVGGTGNISSLCPVIKASDNSAFEATVDGKLHPCFEMEVEASSSAAVSAAAMEAAMEKAQAKLKAAKVVMDLKKDGLQDAKEMGLKTDIDKGQNVQILFNERASGDNFMQTASCKGPTKMKNTGKDRHASTSLHTLPDGPAIEQPNFVTGKSAEGKQGENGSFFTNTAFTEGDGECKEATQYCEFVTNDGARIVPQPLSNGDGKTSTFKQQGTDDGHNLNSAGEACVPEGNRPKLKATIAVSRQGYYEKMVQVAQEVYHGVIDEPVGSEKGEAGMLQGNHKEHKIKLEYEPEKNAEKIVEVQRAKEEKSGEVTRNEEVKMRSQNVLEEREIKKKENKKKETEFCLQEHNDGNTYSPHQSRAKEFPERKEEERRGKEFYERVECDMRVQEVGSNAENEKKEKGTFEKQMKENKLAGSVMQKRDMEGREVKGKRSKEPYGGEGLQTTCESLGNGKSKELKRKVVDKRSKETLGDEFDEDMLKGTSEILENDKRKDILQRDRDGSHFDVAAYGGGSERISAECVELEEQWVYKEAPELVMTRQRPDECQKLAAGDEKSEIGFNLNDNGEKLEKITELEMVENKPMQAGEKKIGDAEDGNAVNGKCLKIELEDEDQVPGNSPDIQLSVEKKHLKSSDVANLLEKSVEVESDTLTSKLKNFHTETDGPLKVSSCVENGQSRAVASDEGSKQKAIDFTDSLVDKHPTKSTAAAQMGADDECERTVIDSESLGRNVSVSKSDQVYARSGQRFKDENGKVAKSVSDPKLVEDSNLEPAGQRRYLSEDHARFDLEEKVNSTPAEGTNGWNEHAKKEDDIDETYNLPTVSLSTEQKGKIIHQRRDSEERIREKEKNLEMEELRKLEEEREREREREKDRMAVEIAIREARERAFADARDRAERASLERATAEARQRAMTEARERLERACAEARERSLADKASDARLRADRAAAERATAEARQRAIDKAIADRANIEARERMQRSVSEKYVSERDKVLRQSSMPSMRGVELTATECEPAQRCKARLERHHRIVERVAKALEEKNMRDLLGQREQDERSRLAQTLDADIKRWSNGKLGNLRALLSTMQYILGPDSGWQPIPLTEVITAAAVKKAYRKATLCVHPDKLQQRGASIQQKYICEKVFDLLKEAWNIFNSEEK